MKELKKLMYKDIIKRKYANEISQRIINQMKKQIGHGNIDIKITQDEGDARIMKDNFISETMYKSMVIPMYRSPFDNIMYSYEGKRFDDYEEMKEFLDKEYLSIHIIVQEKEESENPFIRKIKIISAKEAEENGPVL